MRKPLLLLVALGLLVAPTGAATDASYAASRMGDAATGESARSAPASTGPELSDSEAELDSARAVSRHLGISEAEALKRVRLQNDIAIRMHEARTVVPHVYANSVMEGDGVRILLKATASRQDVAEINRAFSGASVRPQIDASALVNLEEATELASKALDYVSAAAPEVRAVQARPNLEFSAIEVGVLSSQDAADVRASLDDSAKSEFPLPVLVTVVSESPRPAANLVGGAQLNRTNGEAVCTSGFPVYRTGSPNRFGLLTADHCPSLLRYGNSPWLDTAIGGNIAHGDLQWNPMRTGQGNTVTPQFQHAPHQLRYLTGAAEGSTGMVMCRYGRWTSQCASIGVPGLCVNPDLDRYPKRYCGLRDTNERTNSIGGDSGGPWFLGTVAYGVHSGRRGDLYGGGALYTPIWNITRALPGVTLHRRV